MAKVMETWIDLEFDSNYQVSSSGNVRSKDRVIPTKCRWGKDTVKHLKGRELKPCNAGAGYLSVRFNFGGKNYYIHRLVAEHFINGDRSLDINHKDGDKKNNSVDNLEFVTKSQNMLHSTYVLGNRRGQFITNRERHC
jgi:NUMOD4 motif/HNH endonuclease